jgi:hypothetical protein
MHKQGVGLINVDDIHLEFEEPSPYQHIESPTLSLIMGV